ncbi:MAG: hypothetical protein Q9217_004639 [Psora testacea]
MPVFRSILPTANIRTWPFLRPQIAGFHTTKPWQNESMNHYETLGLELNASAGAIKKQFYSLSKAHHPDHNPNDPQASERFMKISEAYAILGSPQKRERYDRDIGRARVRYSQHMPQGSHSSASTPFGSRPASGLSQRRTQFRGPPPSFYRSGGWGSHGAKRQDQSGGSTNAFPRASAGSAGPGGGFSPGQGQAGLYNDVPHFDQESHYRTQQSQEQRWMKRRRDEGANYSNEGADLFLRFLIIGAVVGAAFSVPLWVMGRNTGSTSKDKTPNG